MKKTEFSIRGAKPSDIKEISRLDKKYSSQSFSERELNKFYRKNKNLILVSEINGKIKGFIIGTTEKTGESRIGRIEMVFVDPKYRKIGIGTELIKKILSNFNKSGVKNVYAINPVKNKNAKKLYEKLGFRLKAYHFWKGN